MPHLTDIIIGWIYMCNHQPASTCIMNILAVDAVQHSLIFYFVDFPKLKLRFSFKCDIAVYEKAYIRSMFLGFVGWAR